MNRKTQNDRMKEEDFRKSFIRKKKERNFENEKGENEELS